MAIFAVTYDLNNAKNYQKLWDEFERLGGHKAANSFYFVRVNVNTERELLDHLRQYIDGDDTMIVVKFSSRPATFRAKYGTKEWLDQNL